MNILKKFRKIDIDVILTFIIIFVSNDTLLFGTNLNRNFFWLHVAILLIVFLYLFFHTKSINKHIMIFSISLIVMIEITQVVNLDTEYIKYVYNIFVILLCVVFCKFVNKHKFCNSFVNIIYYIAIFTIVLFILWIFASPVARLFPSITNESGIKYYFFGLGFLENLNSGVLPRMYGIFREPGVFSCFLILALIIQLHFMEQLNIKRVLVTSMAAILTFSTAAYILLFLVLGGYFLKQLFVKKAKHKKILLLFLMILITFAIFFYMFDIERIISIVFNKFKVENSSRDSRYGSIAGNFKIFLQNPIFGKGWKYVEDNFIYFASQGAYQGTHNTNTFLKVLALYGIVPFSCMISLIFVFFKKENNSILWGILLTVIWIIALSNEDMSVNILFYLLPFYAFDKTTRKDNFICESIIN